MPAELLEGIAPGGRYRWEDSDAILVPVGTVRGPVARKLERETLESLAAGIRSGIALPPAPVYMKGEQAILLDGAHRWRVYLTAGFTHLPCKARPRIEAEER